MLNHRLHHGQWLWNDEWLVLLCPLYTIHTHRSSERTKENDRDGALERESSRTEPEPNATTAQHTENKPEQKSWSTARHGTAQQRHEIEGNASEFASVSVEEKWRQKERKKEKEEQNHYHDHCHSHSTFTTSLSTCRGSLWITLSHTRKHLGACWLASAHTLQAVSKGSRSNIKQFIA